MYKLLEESTTETVSQPLYRLVEKVLSQDAPESLQKDLFYVLIIVLMVENGFYPLDLCYNEIKNDKLRGKIEPCNVPADVFGLIDLNVLKRWKSQFGVFETKFMFNNYSNLPLKLIMTPVAAAVLVNVILEELSSETYSVCLPISRYVVSPNASTIPMIFRDLKHLSTTYKNKVIVPAKSRILSHCGYPSASLIGLPDELIIKIVKHLPIFSVINLFKTCKRLKTLIDVDSIWHELCIRDFNVEVTGDEKWKDVYEKLYILAVEEERKKSLSRTVHLYTDNSDISYIDNPMWDVFI